MWAHPHIPGRERPRTSPNLPIGAAAAFGRSRVIASFLFGVTARDALVFTVAPALLTAVAFVGVWLPVRRAANVDQGPCLPPARARGQARVDLGQSRRPLGDDSSSRASGSRGVDPWQGPAEGAQMLDGDRPSAQIATCGRISEIVDYAAGCLE